MATAHFGGRRRNPESGGDEYWDDLVSLAIARPEDRAESDPHFTDTNRTSASPRPGLWIGCNRPLEEAETLDDTGCDRRRDRGAPVHDRQSPLATLKLKHSPCYLNGEFDPRVFDAMPMAIVPLGRAVRQCMPRTRG